MIALDGCYARQGSNCSSAAVISLVWKPDRSKVGNPA